MGRRRAGRGDGGKEDPPVEKKKVLNPTKLRMISGKKIKPKKEDTPDTPDTPLDISKLIEIEQSKQEFLREQTKDFRAQLPKPGKDPTILEVARAIIECDGYIMKAAIQLQ